MIAEQLETITDVYVPDEGDWLGDEERQSLTPQIVIDIVSFLLKSNNMPPGNAELPADLDALKTVFMEYRP